MLHPFSESILVSDNLVKGAVMFGTGQFQNGVLIEPVQPVDPEDSAAVSDFIDAIWSVTASSHMLLAY
jgi:hypothetical protein